MKWYKKIEIPLLLVTTGFYLSGSLKTQLLIYRTCYITLGFNESDCALLGTVTTPKLQELERIVQPTANIFGMIQDLMLNQLSVIICLFSGHWSDKYGRKPVQLLSLTGLVINCGLLSIFLCFKNLSPWYLIMTSVPTVVSGGTSTYYGAVLPYLNDISTEETIAVRMITFEMALIVSLFIATISSAPLFYATNYETVFFLCTVLILLGALYTKYYLPESIKVEKKIKINYMQMLNCIYVVDLVKVTFKRRGEWKRTIIILLMLSLVLINFTTNGASVIKFQFLRKKLAWTLKKHNYYICFSNIISILGTITGTLLVTKIFKKQESVIILVGIVSLIGSSLLWAIATNDYYIYVGSFVAVLADVSAPLIRTRLAQIVPPEEMGKIFSLVVAFSGLSSIAASYVYTRIYNITLNINPGIFNFMSVVLYFIAFLLTLNEMNNEYFQNNIRIQEVYSLSTKNIYGNRFAWRDNEIIDFNVIFSITFVTKWVCLFPS